MARFTADQSVSDVVNDPAHAEAAEEATRPPAADGVILKLAERVGTIARASTVFGEPVERAGLTVIPVARVRSGFGGGSGGDEKGGTGEGGGGGAMVTPIGWIEITDSESRFRPLVSRGQRISGRFGLLAFVAIVLGVLLGGRRTTQRRRSLRLPGR